MSKAKKEDKRKTCWRCGKKVNAVHFTGEPVYHDAHKDCNRKKSKR
jgi:hypothetical protein